MNVQCKLCNIKLVDHRTSSLMINRLCIKHEEKTAETENIQSLITSLANSHHRTTFTSLLLLVNISYQMHLTV